MQPLVAVRVLGLLLMMFSAALLPPVIVSVIYDDGELTHLATTVLITLACGFLLWLPGRGRDLHIRTRDGFVIVALMWFAVSLLGSLPFIFGLKLPLTDAVFETASGFTTTGATVITGLDALPPSILFYRQELQWLGGIGFVVAAVALLPLLGIGGMQLFRAETPGPMKDDKLTPRVAHTARYMLNIYLGLTAVCALLYWLAGMSLFDAIAHSLTTVATGGFSTHDASLAYFDSPLIEAIAIVFMLAGGINFYAHFFAWRDRNPRHYWQHAEVRVFLYFVLLVTIVVTLTLFATGARATLPEALRYGAFEVVSIVTSTGYGIDDFSGWPLQLPAMLIFISFVGGCAASTAGGMKVIRYVILGKQALVELQQLIHPHIVRPPKLQGRVIETDVARAVWGFFALYTITSGILLLLLMASGMDQVTAFGAVAASINNLGPGLGEVAANFTTVSDFAKWVSALAMIVGRLEVFTILVLLSPAFWRR